MFNEKKKRSLEDKDQSDMRKTHKQISEVISLDSHGRRRRRSDRKGILECVRSPASSTIHPFIPIFDWLRRKAG